MNSDLLLALGLALAVVVVLAVVMLRRGKRSPGAGARPTPPPHLQRQVQPQPQRQVPQPQPQSPPAPWSGPDTATQIDVQRQAATEALRQARQRKADEAARLQAERERQARADAEAQAKAQAQAQARPPAPAPAPMPRPAPAPVAAAAQPLPRSAAPQPAERPILSPLAISPSPTPSQFGGLGLPGGPASQVPPPAPGLAPLRRVQPARPPLVLLADDSKVVRVKTGRLLEKQGWQVLLAEDGETALQALDTHAPDLLITDVEMPGIDGFELTRQVRAHARFARLPVIMITSSDTRHRAEANAAGVNLLLGKPYAEETLLAQVKAMLDAAAQRAGSGVALH